MSAQTFSGHDTFHCRQFWLKKAYDHVGMKKGFNDDNASLELGVGRNMVTAIRYWAKQFQILNEHDQPTTIANKLLGEKGWDPYLEDEGSLWLLHYLLVTKNDGASTFHIMFNELIKERPEFNSEVYTKYVHQTKGGGINENTLKKDFTVFYKTYYADFEDKDIEESFTGILTELELLKQKHKTVIGADGKTKEKKVWLIDRTVRPNLPFEILLYAIIDQHGDSRSISFNQLYHDVNSPGAVFALSKEGLTIALEQLAEASFGSITFSNQAGVRELQFKKSLKAIDILEKYYGE